MTPVIGVIVIVEITCQLPIAVALVPLTNSDKGEVSSVRPLMASPLIIRSAGPLIICLSLLSAAQRELAKLLSFTLTKTANAPVQEEDYQNK